MTHYRGSFPLLVLIVVRWCHRADDSEHVESSALHQLVCHVVPGRPTVRLYTTDAAAVDVDAVNKRSSAVPSWVTSMPYGWCYTNGRRRIGCYWGVGCTPPPQIFFVQKCYFSHISPKFVLIGLQKIGLSVTEDYRRDEKCQFTAKCLAK